jgi:FSR family fosmidomycin resistance protein-like MFS transporter
MTVQVQAQPLTTEEQFQTGQVVTISAGHFVHDTYTAFLAPLLPLLREQLGISLAQAGILAGVSQLPSLLNPLIGYLDDKMNLKILLILSPSITATLMVTLGLMPSYSTLVILLLLVGLSVAALHALSPALLARVSGRNTGKAMSFFMASGELGRTLGPLLVTLAASYLTLKNLWPLALPAWLVSILMFSRLWKVDQPVMRRPSLRGMLPQAGRFFIPLTLIVITRTFMVSALGTFLPTFLKGEGAALWAAGATLSAYQLAGTAGAFVGGTLSDRLGRKRVLAIAMAAASGMTLLYLKTSGVVGLLVLLVIGFSNLSIQPVLLALVQDHFPEARSVANGIFLAINFLLLSVTAYLIGVMGDAVGLRQAYTVSSFIGLIGIPVLFFLPKRQKEQIKARPNV